MPTLDTISDQRERDYQFSRARQYWLDRGFSEVQSAIMALAMHAPTRSGIRIPCMMWTYENTNMRARDLV